MIRKLRYLDNEELLSFFRVLVEQENKQHWEKIRFRCLALQSDAEEQADVQRHGDIYSVFLGGLSLKGMASNEGYTISFLLTKKEVIILEIEDTKLYF
jgi:hypothetical protein